MVTRVVLHWRLCGERGILRRQSGRGAAWQRAAFGTLRSRVQIPPSRPEKHQVKAALRGGQLVWYPFPSRVHRASDEASSAVVVPFREELVAESFGGVAVGFGAGLGVDAECEPRVGVTEPGLGGLEVDAFEDESAGGVGAAEVVELGPLDAGLVGGRDTRSGAASSSSRGVRPPNRQTRMRRYLSWSVPAARDDRR